MPEANENVLEKLSVMKSDEIFYKTYYEARKSPVELKIKWIIFVQSVSIYGLSFRKRSISKK